jgi:lipopolysaccharide/colanic/teichoic acid biosynthesis glycosyltransferase
MNYHTTIIPSPVKEFSAKEEKLISRNYPIPRRNTYLWLKRGFDVVFSLLFIGCVFIWLLPIISLLITFESQGPVFFVQRRI